MKTDIDQFGAALTDHQVGPYTLGISPYGAIILSEREREPAQFMDNVVNLRYVAALKESQFDGLCSQVGVWVDDYESETPWVMLPFSTAQLLGLVEPEEAELIGEQTGVLFKFVMRSVGDGDAATWVWDVLRV